VKRRNQNIFFDFINFRNEKKANFLSINLQKVTKFAKSDNFFEISGIFSDKFMPTPSCFVDKSQKGGEF